jgi:signal transduction histidine kinase
VARPIYRLAARVHAGVGEYDTALNYAEQAYQTMRTVADTARGSAVTAAVARSAVVEREAALELTRTRAALDAERAQARLVQTRVILSVILGAVILLGVIGFSRFRLVQARRRDNAVTEERTRVARDLHDTALQGFMAVTMQLQVAARTAAGTDTAAMLSSLARDAGASLAQVRNAVWQMRSPILASGDLRAAITDWLDSRRDDQGAIAIELDGLPDRLDQVKAEALLRVVQEAVNNAIIHGEASRIAVGAQTRDGKLAMTIVDNGKGFAPTDAAAMGGHWGLLGMRERIEALGGALAVDSAPGRGTTITATIPA